MDDQFERLLRTMQKVQCKTGITQIGRILDHAKKEKAPLVFVGDAMEESSDVLVGKAGARHAGVHVPRRSGSLDRERLSRHRPRFPKRHARFDAGAGKRLSEPKAAAVYATGGIAALEGRKDEASKLLIEQLKGSGVCIDRDLPPLWSDEGWPEVLGTRGLRYKYQLIQLVGLGERLWTGQ